MIAAIVKTINLASLAARADYPWDTVDLTIWIAVEQYLIILAACIPTLTPLFNIVVRQRTSKKSTSNVNYKPGHQSGRSHPYDGLASGGIGKSEPDGYPLAWTRVERARAGSHSDSEDPIMATTESGRGILMTTEFHVQTGSEDGDDHVERR